MRSGSRRGFGYVDTGATVLISSVLRAIIRHEHCGGRRQVLSTDKAVFHATTAKDENKMLLERIALMPTQLIKSRRPTEVSNPGPRPAFVVKL
jgi:hypothetical protein